MENTVQNENQSANQEQKGLSKKQSYGGILLGLAVIIALASGGNGAGMFFSWLLSIFAFSFLLQVKSGIARFGGSFLLACVMLAFFSVLLVDRDTNQSSRSTGSSSPVEVKEEAKLVEESCAELANAFGVSSELSDLQKEEAWKQFEGRVFKWDLRVTEVSSDMFGGFTVQYKCAKGTDSLVQDVMVSYPDNKKSFVIGLRKGKVYKIRGRLSDSFTLLGITAEDI